MCKIVGEMCIDSYWKEIELGELLLLWYFQDVNTKSI